MRNKTHSFSAIPEANIQRSKFDIPCNVKFTGNTGKLIPFYVAEVLPGDTFNISTSVVCRLQTLIHPLMDNLYLDTYYFFVPNRLVWDNWKHFCGEPNKAWLPDQEWTVPMLKIYWDQSEYTGDTVYAKRSDYLKKSFKDSVIDYMGLGISRDSNMIVGVNSLPIRAYNKIYDDWFRDENLIDPVNLYTGDNEVNLITRADYADPLKGGACYTACKLHDYFTSALPDAQRGNPASLTTGESVMSPVFTGGSIVTGSKGYGTHFDNVLNNSSGYSMSAGSFRSSDGTYSASGFARNTSPIPSSNDDRLFVDNQFVDLSNLNLGITINDLRMAFQVQKFMEKSARGGARYIEIINNMFGVKSPDGRLQRSEYLGGHRVPINIHQVINQAESVDNALGNTGAMSVTSDVHNDFIHSFVEHGFVIGICCVRYKHTYPQGFDKMWGHFVKFDYYWPVFAHIGEQPILNSEIIITNETDNGNLIMNMPFGYQEAWAEYRYKPNRVMGEMRPGIPNTLASWHLADYYTQTPFLSEDWIKEDIMPVDRAIAVTSSVADQFLFDILINNKATRPLPLYSVPGLADHF